MAVSSYAEIFRAPGSGAFTVAGFIGRMPLAMVSIGIVTMLSRLRGDYAVAAAVAATFTLSVALLGPQVARVVDRVGQSRVLPIAAAVSVSSLGALLWCAHAGAAVWTLFLFAVPAGAMPSLSAMTRARWSMLYAGRPLLRTAFSLESVMDDITFVVGPALSVGLSTMVYPSAGPLVAGLLLLLGVAMLTPLRRTEPPPSTGPAASGSALAVVPLRLVVVVLVCAGSVLGTMDVVAVAFGDERADSSAAGIILAVYALGSAITGLVYGTLRIRLDAARQLLLAVGGSAVASLPLLLVDSVWSFSATVLVAGAFFSPMMIVLLDLTQRAVPPGRLTEAMTWTVTGLTVGIAAGSLTTGLIVDAFGARGGFVGAIAGSFATLAVAALSYRRLLRVPDELRPAEPAVAAT